MKFAAVLSAAVLVTFVSASPLATSTPAPTPMSEPACSCDEQICVASWPESCYCANRDKMDCYNKCGGTKPKMQDCST